MKSERINIDYSNPHIAFKQVCGIFKDCVVWSSDEPWTTSGNISDKMSVVGVSYGKEAELYESCDFKEELSFNVRKYLFGY